VCLLFPLSQFFAKVASSLTLQAVEKASLNEWKSKQTNVKFLDITASYKQQGRGCCNIMTMPVTNMCILLQKGEIWDISRDNFTSNVVNTMINVRHLWQKFSAFVRRDTVTDRERERETLNTFSIASAVSLRPHTTAYINLDVAICCELEQELENQWLHSTALYHFTTVGYICLQWILLKKMQIT